MLNQKTKLRSRAVTKREFEVCLKFGNKFLSKEAQNKESAAIYILFSCMSYETVNEIRSV